MIVTHEYYHGMDIGIKLRMIVSLRMSVSLRMGLEA